MLRLVMDSAGDLPEEWLSELDIRVIPINIHFGERTYLQGVDLSNADFFRMADQTRNIPKTSQPSPQQFIDFYNEHAQPGDTIISIHVTGKLSGTLASAQIAAKELAKKFRIFPIDSASGSASMGYMCREARLMERAGASVEAIVERLGRISRSVQICLTLNTMEYARRSGRVKYLQAVVASLLDIKPVIVLKDGVIEVTDRVRTRHKALELIVEKTVQKVGRKLVNAAVVHCEDPAAGEGLMQRVRERLNCQELFMSDLSIGVAANLGPGTVGVVAYPVEGA